MAKCLRIARSVVLTSKLHVLLDRLSLHKLCSKTVPLCERSPTSHCIRRDERIVAERDLRTVPAIQHKEEDRKGRPLQGPHENDDIYV